MKYGKFDWGNQITSNMPKSKEQGLVEVKAKDLIYMMQRFVRRQTKVNFSLVGVSC
jgi:hypothetical protein